MIDYDPGRWSLYIIFKCRGSVFPTAILFATPCAVLASILHHLLHMNEDLIKTVGIGGAAATTYGGFSFVLGFLVVFRAQLAYNRWWEGGTLLCQLRGEWFDSYSALMAFCNAAPEKREDVANFRHMLVRLYSLLYACALAHVSPNKDDVGQVSLNTFELINMDGLDPEALRFLSKTPNMVEVTLQWIQRLIVESEQNKTLLIAPPILSRVFNELGNGIVCLDNAKKIKDFPFPFPMAQIAMGMLLVQTVFTPLLCAATVQTKLWAALLTFVVSFCYWSVSYIALELEMPYGDDPNDLPLYDMALDMNISLKTLLDPMAHSVPNFNIISSSGLACWDVDLDTDLSVTARSPSLLNADDQKELKSIESAAKKLRVCSSNIRAAAFVAKSTDSSASIGAHSEEDRPSSKEHDRPSRHVLRTNSAPSIMEDDDAPVRTTSAPSVLDGHLKLDRTDPPNSDELVPFKRNSLPVNDFIKAPLAKPTRNSLPQGRDARAKAVIESLTSPNSGHSVNLHRPEIEPPEFVHSPEPSTPLTPYTVQPQEPSTPPLAMPQVVHDNVDRDLV